MDALIGRSEEAGALDAALTAALEGVGTALLIEGEAGIGKSHLLAHAVEQARALGLSVRAGAGEPLEGNRPFGAIGRALGDGRPVPAPPVDASRHRNQDAYLAAVERLALQGPTLVVLDDLHWFDEPSVATVVLLARRVRDLPLALVLAARPTPRLPDEALDALLGAGTRHLHLGPLPPDDVGALVEQALGARPDDGLRRLIEGAHGNPFLVLELVRALDEEHTLEHHDGVVRSRFHGIPPSLRQTVLRRIRALGRAPTDLLRGAAVLGGPFDLDVVAAVLDQPTTALHQPALDALDARLLTEDGDLLRFRHDLIRESIYLETPAAVRRSLHRRAADVLQERRAPVGLVATQLVLGGDPTAAPRLRDAARALAPDDPAAALDLLDRAAELDPSTPEEPELLVQRAALLAAVGRLQDAEATARAVLAAAGPGALQGRARVALAEVLLLLGDAPAAVEELDHVLRTGGLGAQDHALLLADAAWARLATFDLAGAAADAERALEQAAEADAADPEIVSSALAVQCRLAAFDLDLDTAVDLGRRAVAATTERRGWRRTPHLFLGLALVNADRHDEAAAVLAEGRRRAEEDQVPWAMATYHAAVINHAFFTGRWDDATAEAEAARRLHEEAGTRREYLQTESMLGLMWFHRGDLDEARDSRRRAEADAAVPGHDAGGLIWLLWLQAALTEADGDVAGASALVGVAFDLALDTRVHLVKLWFGPEVVRLALAVGDRDRAAAVAEAVAEVAARAGTPAALGASALCRGRVAGDPGLLAEAVEAYERSGRVPALARALEALAEVQHRAGDDAAARDSWTRALDRYEHLGAEHDLRRLRQRLRDLGIRVGSRAARRRPATGLGSLTPAERAVLDLVAAGLGNGEIAQRLFVSRRTVETHMGRLYRKLGVTGRVALAALGTPPPA